MSFVQAVSVTMLRSQYAHFFKELQFYPLREQRFEVLFVYATNSPRV
jgi:hypothetical protein